MTQNKPVNEVEDFVSFEAMAAMTAVGMSDESEKTDDHDSEYTPMKQQPRNDIE